MNSEKKYKRLDEVTLMRTILALLIVFMHSFTCYQGSWTQPPGFVEIPAYKWVARASFAFTLESFVFLSGYLFAFQRITLKRAGGGKSLIINKLKRLILPSMAFSILYFCLFSKYQSVSETVYTIINGCGHMWFLPMLFWCFVLAWFVLNIKIREEWKLFFLAVLNLCVLIQLPLRLSESVIYLVYFYGGYLLYSKKAKTEGIITPRYLIILWSSFVVLFVILRPMQDYLEDIVELSFFLKLIFGMASNLCRLVFASVGLMAFYCTAVYYTKKHQISETTKNIAACCFGIYLFQQFILMILYYRTDVPLELGAYWLPWCGFVITTFLSYVLSFLLLKTKVGRFLIG